MCKLRRSIQVGLSFLLASAIIQNCGDGNPRYTLPKFEKETSCSFCIFSDDLGFNVVNDLFVFDSFVIIVALDITTNTQVHIYDKSTGVSLADAVNFGRGPGETISGTLFPTMDLYNGVLTLNDVEQGKQIFCSINDIVNKDSLAAISQRDKDYHAWEDAFFLLDDGKTLVMNNVGLNATVDSTNTQRFVIWDDTNGVVAKNDGYPVEKVSRLRWNLYSRPPADLSPDKSKLAVGTLYGVILETFQIDGTDIRNSSTSYFIDPKFGESDPWDCDITFGIGDISASDDMIYATYDGHNGWNDDSMEDFQAVAVFDWNGKPKQLISCGIRMERICADPSSGRLYAVVSDKEGKTFLAYIPLPELD